MWLTSATVKRTPQYLDMGFHHRVSNKEEAARILADHPNEPSCIKKWPNGLRLFSGLELSRAVECRGSSSRRCTTWVMASDGLPAVFTWEYTMSRGSLGQVCADAVAELAEGENAAYEVLHSVWGDAPASIIIIGGEVKRCVDDITVVVLVP
ncbi:hypothetical protein MKEN_00583600 [Mycena kentingensis (nom. inval.)]|nr:hypothetical protein MKEN_00583600 [Mycena kentingensis (nom. inval.)]